MLRLDDMARTATLLCASLLVAACAVGPDYREPDTEVDGQFDAASLLEDRGQGEIEREWWRQFADPVLDELVDAAVKNNRDVAAATARLREARALRRERLFDFLPSITGKASYNDVRQSAAATPGVPPGTPVDRDYQVYDAGFDAGWELDLFGRVRRANESARAAAQAASAARNQVVLSVIAEVARNYFELRGVQSQLEVARTNAGTQARALELVNARLEAGRGTALDTARATAQVESTLASVPPLEAAVDRAMRRIAVLTGQQPGAMDLTLTDVRALPAMPASIPLGTPEALLRRRPDIRAAERQLAAATAAIGVQVADLFPRISIDASIGLSAPTFGQLDDSGNDRRSFGPSLSWGLLDFGHVYQRIRAADARSAEALATYEQTVLLALEETENALSDFARERRRLEHLTRAAEASREAADLATQRFEGGVSDFLSALDAYRTSLEAEDQLAISRTRAATALVTLYKALGGGWEIAPRD
ncbi:MAG TPA: efflux transporter outer membrane subunit [Steroidobacteraceae bacterium]|nr:efflux transporter outer membrane subunit [Steroidobacteraceae bacterium]